MNDGSRLLVVPKRIAVKLIVGLGNPGRQYEHTRHNVGWMVLDRVAERAGLTGRGKERDAAIVVRGRYRDLDIVLAKPLTYMNESGVAVRKLLARERVPLADLLIVYDDFDLPFGKLRMREAGSAGTHNGLRSIVAEMGTQKIPRLRVGIGEPGQSRDARDHVLSRFSEQERRELDMILDAAADAVEDWATVGAARAANRWNAWSLPTPHEQPPTAEGSTEPGPATQPPTGGSGIVRTRTGWRKLLPGGRATESTR
jgi:PTH1 family peptidyl-tRNA hydrolase